MLFITRRDDRNTQPAQQPVSDLEFFETINAFDILFLFFLFFPFFLFFLFFLAELQEIVTGSPWNLPWDEEWLGILDGWGHEGTKETP